MKTNFLLSSISILLLFAFSVQAQVDERFEQMTLDDINSSEFGQGPAFGFNIFGDGLGFVFRYGLPSEHQFGSTINFFSVAEGDFSVNGNGLEAIYPGIFIRPEFNLHLGNGYKEKMKQGDIKRKFRKHYLSAKVGAGFSVENIYSFALTWHRETFLLRNKSHARGLDLGINYNIVPTTSRNLVLSSVGIYLRFDWTWFQRNK